ncbi:hypothetical protein SSS_01347 [Sarcoptes scabiei]|uniref:Uncharacterized protein n=1 Tax=Sarcoptes scabiei TaxID=52283 RepID=A0A834R7J2_SARSC|nr:hypothetical protein SSS_01347 [Sarcoptes scabiei]
MIQSDRNSSRPHQMCSNRSKLSNTLHHHPQREQQCCSVDDLDIDSTPTSCTPSIIVENFISPSFVSDDDEDQINRHRNDLRDHSCSSVDSNIESRNNRNKIDYNSIKQFHHHHHRINRIQSNRSKEDSESSFSVKHNNDRNQCEDHTPQRFNQYAATCLYVFDQETFPRKVCLQMISNPYPFQYIQSVQLVVIFIRFYFKLFAY